MQRISYLFSIALLVLVSNVSFALPSDSEQPIRVQADTADLDNNKGVLVYKGNVIITQGTMKVMGHTVTITRNKDGGIDVMTAQGGPAYYEQQPNVNDPVMKAYGKTIQYQVAKKLVILLTNAKVIQKNNVFTGDKIVYDVERKLISAGKASSSNGSSAKNNRIDVLIYPEKKQK